VDPIGVVAVMIFVGVLVASVRGWIPQRVLPIQAALLLVAVVVTAIALIAGRRPAFGNFMSVTNLHPITATIAGFVFAGALKAAGGFDAAADLLKRVRHTPLGSPFAVMLLVNLPTILAMPCGRIIVSALVPVALLLGIDLARQRGDDQLPAMIMFGLVVNAAASCGPSLIGGIGSLGEGMARFPTGSFSDPHQIAIVIITVVTMALVKFVLRPGIDRRLLQNGTQTVTGAVPQAGYLAFAIFVIGLALIVLFRIPVPIQTVLMGMTIIVMAVARLSLKDLLEGILLHPLTAMIAGFIVAGVLEVFGGFDALLMGVEFVSTHTPLGHVGVAVVLVYLPIIIPLPCGRVIAVSLIPGVLMFGVRLGEFLGNPAAAAILMVSFILSAAASCGPSPLGGIGSIGEGNLRLPVFISGKPQAFGIFIGVPVAALIVSVLGLTGGQNLWYTILTIAIVSGVAVNLLLGEKFYHQGGFLGGAAVGALMILF
jgi:hypothetical protein